MKWDVVEVKPELPLSLHVRFADGTVGKVRFETSYFTGVFKVLLDQNLFQQVRVEAGAIVWPQELDLAPDAMYEAIKAKGEWILR